jgi:hypothetical protein
MPTVRPDAGEADDDVGGIAGLHLEEVASSTTRAMTSRTS